MLSDVGYVMAVKNYTAFIGFIESDYRSACSSFTAARLADKSECLTLIDIEAYTFTGMKFTRRCLKIFSQVRYFKHLVFHS